MKVTVLGPNLPNTEYTFHVHKFGCADIKKMKTYVEHEGDTLDVDDEYELVDIVGGETGTGIEEFKFYACTKSMSAAKPKVTELKQLVKAIDDDEREVTRRDLAEQVKAFAQEHRNDKLREWDIIADHWTINQMVAELEAAPTKIRTYGGARRHFDWLVRLPNDKPAWAGTGSICMGGADRWPDA
jgi:hypothetical protein